MRRIPTLLLFGVVCTLSMVRADTTTVSFDSGSATLSDQVSTPLSGGTALNGDGDVLQLGYYSSATTSNNFQGTWIPLSGQGSANTAVIPGGPVTNPTNETYNQTSIGDLTSNGASTGQFAISLDFVQGNATSGNSLPAAGVPLAIRFYNGTTIANSTFYNVVSDDLWVWKTPNTPPTTVTPSLNDSGLEWLSIALGQTADTAFRTTISLSAGPGAFNLGRRCITRFLSYPDNPSAL